MLADAFRWRGSPSDRFSLSRRRNRFVRKASRRNSCNTVLALLPPWKEKTLLKECDGIINIANVSITWQREVACYGIERTLMGGDSSHQCTGGGLWRSNSHQYPLDLTQNGSVDGMSEGMDGRGYSPSSLASHPVHTKHAACHTPPNAFIPPSCSYTWSPINEPEADVKERRDGRGRKEREVIEKGRGWERR